PHATRRPGPECAGHPCGQRAPDPGTGFPRVPPAGAAASDRARLLRGIDAHGDFRALECALGNNQDENPSGDGKTPGRPAAPLGGGIADSRLGEQVDHEQLEENLSLYALGALDPDSSSEME